MSDASDADDIESIREEKLEELRSRTELDEPVHVESSDHFDELVADNDVVLVDFYADWCGPCQMLEPVVGAIAEETGAVVAKVDVDEHQDLARQYSVQGVPTLFVYAGGERQERLVGMQDEATLFQTIEGYL
jgi:thioredoxin 1